MKVALINCPVFQSDEEPHIGLAYISALLKKNNIKTKVFDINQQIYFENSRLLYVFQRISAIFPRKHESSLYDVLPERLLKFLFPEKINYPLDLEKFGRMKQDVETRAAEIEKYSPEIIGFTINATNAYYSALLAKRLKKQNRTIIFGGPSCIDNYIDLFLKLELCDYVITGEGELSFLKLTQQLIRGKNPEKSDIPGLCFIKGSDVVKNKPAYIGKLSELPFPDFGSNEYKKLPVVGSRGCINECSHCTDRILWPGYRQRPVEDIVDELELRTKMNNTKSFEFQDSLLNPAKKRLNKLADEIISRNLNISWDASFVCRNLDKDTILALEKAGCTDMSFGIESFSEDVLKIMNKSTKKSEMVEILENVAKTKIQPGINLIVGYPGETQEMFLDSLNTLVFVINKTQKFLIMTPQQFQLRPNCSIHNNPKKFGITLIRKKQKLPADFDYLRETMNKYSGWKYDSVPTNEESYNRIMFMILLKSCFFKRIKSVNNNVIYLDIVAVAKKNTGMLEQDKSNFLDLDISAEELLRDTGKKILSFIELINQNKYKFSFERPLPPCIFGSSFNDVFEKSGIPDSCENCRNALIRKGNKVILCRNKLKMYFKLDEEDYSKFECLEREDLEKVLPEICRKCKYRIRDQCSYVKCGDHFSLD